MQVFKTLRIFADAVRGLGSSISEAAKEYAAEKVIKDRIISNLQTLPPERLTQLRAYRKNMPELNTVQAVQAFLTSELSQRFNIKATMELSGLSLSMEKYPECVRNNPDTRFIEQLDQVIR